METIFSKLQRRESQDRKSSSPLLSQGMDAPKNIGRVAGPEIAVELMKTSKLLHGLFKDQPILNKLLQLIAYGEQDRAEKLLNIARIKDPTGELIRQLLSAKGQVVDYSGRVFDGITAFQYALWAKDHHMWKMLLNYLSLDKAREQLQQHEREDSPLAYVKKHGKYYDLTRLVSALQFYLDYVNGSNVDWSNGGKAEQIWIKTVGGQQREVPAHIAQEYCHPDRTFYLSDENESEVKRFQEPMLKRQMTIYNNITSKDELWFPLAGNSGLGVDFANYRGKWETRDGGGFATDLPMQGGDTDLEALISLCEIRTKDLETLKSKLLYFDTEMTALAENKMVKF